MDSDREIFDRIMAKLTEEEKHFLDLHDYPRAIDSGEDDPDLEDQNQMNVYLFNTSDKPSVSKFRKDFEKMLKKLKRPEIIDLKNRWKEIEPMFYKELGSYMKVRQAKIKFFNDYKEQMKEYNRAILEFKKSWKPKKK